VQKIFSGVFGRQLRVNPLTFLGLALKESKANASHDGRLVELPIKNEEVDPDAVYEYGINNCWRNEYALTIRVPVVGEEIPFVFRYWRNIESRFGDGKSLVELSDAPSEFSDSELKKLFEMARTMGVDFGMMDVLRSVVDRQIYVVDVNSIPTGPTPAVRPWVRIRAMAKLRDSSRRQFIERRYSRFQTSGASAAPADPLVAPSSGDKACPT
jgi:hypothetical protein